MTFLVMEDQDPVLAGSTDPAPAPIRDRPSANSLRTTLRTQRPSLRAVTPDMPEAGLDASDGGVPLIPRGVGSHESSPRSMPGGASRRQGMVFNEELLEPVDTGDPGPPLPPRRHASGTLTRPRTQTMDTLMMSQRSSIAVPGGRHRMSSVSSGGASPPAVEDNRQSLGPMLESVGFPGLGNRVPDVSAMAASNIRERKTSSRVLVKRPPSRPASPNAAAPLSLDSLPYPVAASDSNKIVMLMKILCGKMRGDIEYQGETSGPWHTGSAYIDEERACLMFDSGQHGPFHIPLVSDLRGCRVLPVDYPDVGKQCLELVSVQPAIEIVINPLTPEEYDLWLAALLCWQHMRPPPVRTTNGKSGSPAGPTRPELRRRGSSTDHKATNIIKIGKALLWDKGPASSPRSMVKRSSTRDPRCPSMAWKPVSCTLQDNGDFKLLVENDNTALTTIELSQLSRRAIQQLDGSVLNEEFCVAISPRYAPSSKQLSVFRPVYLAFENRIQFEVWFALLRAFTEPEMFKQGSVERDASVLDGAEGDEKQDGEPFRVERTIGIRVTESKIKAWPTDLEHPRTDRGRKSDPDPLVGNYAAEVIVDGEVRARTTTRSDTKNPFWREDYEFLDLPSTLPQLSVLLKLVEESPESLSQQLQASQTARGGSQNEHIFGTLEVPLHQMERGKDHEQWLQVLDGKQQVVATMLTRVSHAEQVVLLAQEYEPLAEVLHRFTTGLTTMISGALPGQLRRIAELFLNIFQVSGAASDWLMALVEDEIDGIGSQTTMKKYRFNSRLRSNDSMESTSDRELIVRDLSKNLAGEANLLFRGNSLLTQSLEFHMRRLGKEYLKDILSDKIEEINEINPDCEVDPSRLAPGVDVDHRWSQLSLLTAEIWQCIAGSAASIPPELRHILKYIRAVAEDRYGDFLRTVAYTSVSGFFFLRFLCPAILSPKLFGLLRDHPRPRAQRTFTLITKALQKLANLSTFGKREEWMEPMNRFLTSQRQGFKDFLDRVCDIPAEQGSTRALPASYSTPLTMMRRLGPMSREGFPSLPYLIDGTRNYAALAKLWVDSKPRKAENEPMDGELLIFNDLCLALQGRVDACHARLEDMRTAEGALHVANDEMAEALEQAILIQSLSPSNNSGVPGQDATSSTTVGDSQRGPGSSGSDLTDEVSGKRRSRDMRGSPSGGAGGPKHTGLRHVSDAVHGGSARVKNGGKVGRSLLGGIMRMGAGSAGGGAERGGSPDAKGRESKRPK